MSTKNTCKCDPCNCTNCGPNCKCGAECECDQCECCKIECKCSPCICTKCDANCKCGADCKCNPCECCSGNTKCCACPFCCGGKKINFFGFKVPAECIFGTTTIALGLAAAVGVGYFIAKKQQKK